MASTSNLKKSPVQSRISTSVNYNNNSDYQPPPRQILPMSRPTQHLSQNRSYVQQQQQLVVSPQIIVPTQFGQPDFSLPHIPPQQKDVYLMQAPIQNVPIDYYHSQQQQNYFHSIPAYPSYYPQPIHHQPSYSSMSSQPPQGGQSRQQQPSTTSSPTTTTTASPSSSPSPLAGFCEICTPNLRQGIPMDQIVNNTACDKCKNAYWSHQANMSRPQSNVSSTVVPQNQLQRDLHQPPQQMLQSQQQRQVLNQSISSRPQVVAPTVPAQSENPQSVSSTIPSDSMVSDMPICFSSEQLPTISYDNGPKDQAKTSLLRDVFFSSGMSDDVDLMDVLHFDSDTSSDTEVFTPGCCSPPLSPLSPTSPKEFCAGDEELYSFFYNEQPDELDEKKVDAMAIDQTLTKVSRSIKTCNTYSDLKKRIATNNLVSDNNVNNNNNNTSRLTDAFPFTQSQALAVSPLAVIDPMLLLSNRTVNDENSNKNNDQVVATDSASVIDPMMSLRLTDNRIRPNFIDIDNSADLSSPPLRTPELVSDSSRKRKASYISSSDEGSDNEGNTQKKICADNLMRSGLESMNFDHEDGYVRPCDTILEQEEYMASSDSVSTDSEQDDDEEYRPSPTSTKKVTPIIKKSKPSKSKASLKTKSRKSKSANHLRQKSKNVSLKRGGGKAPAKTVISKKSTKLSVPSSPLAESPAPSEASHVEQEHQEEEPVEELELCDPRPTQSPTIFESLTQAGVDWCRYCGTTEGVNWRPGPWGKRTLCNKHGCDYKGYGFACKLPRLDLTSFVDEAVEKRDRPVLQLFCTGCHKQESYVGNVLVRCEGCPRAFHQKCHPTGIDDETVNNNEHWYCERSCHDNLRRKRIVVELPRKRLPLMSTPKAQASTPSESSPVANVGTTSRPRTSRNSART